MLVHLIIIFSMLVVVPLSVVMMILPIGQVIHQWRHPDDNEAFAKAMAAVKENPSQFTLTNSYSIEASDGEYNLRDSGYLFVDGNNIKLSSYQEILVRRAVRRLWKACGRRDSAKVLNTISN